MFFTNQLPINIKAFAKFGIAFTFNAFCWRLILPLLLLISGGAFSQTYQFSSPFQIGGGFMTGTNEISGIYTEGSKAPLLLTAREEGDLSCQGPTLLVQNDKLFAVGCGTSNQSNFDKVVEIRKESGDSFNAEEVFIYPYTYRSFPTDPYESLLNVYVRGFKNGVQKGEIHLTNLIHNQEYRIDISAYSGFDDLDMLYFFVDNQELFIDNLTLSPVSAPVVLPTVSTSSALGIQSDKAVLGGFVSNDGGAAVTSSGVVWSTTPNPNLTSNQYLIGAGVGSFSETIFGLPFSSTIYVRAFAVNSAGVAYGNEISFSTPATLKATILSISPESCTGNDGAIELGATGGVPPYTFTWLNDNSTLSSRNDLTAGSYTIRVTDFAGEIATAIVNLGSQDLLSVDVSLTHVTCPGGLNGSATVSVTGGSGNYSYTWSIASQSGTQANNLGAGDYSVTVLDQSGCQVVRNFTITEPLPLAIGIASTTNVTCIGGNDGALQIIVSGGTPPYNYTWTPTAENSANLFNLTAGTYQVTVTDNNSCTATQSVTIDQPDLPLMVSTGAVTGILSQTADVSGSAIEDISGFGESAGCIVRAGFVYSTTSGPELGSGMVVYSNPFVLSAFSASLTGLSPNSIHYVRAFVENRAGVITYGNQESFETPPLSLSISGTFSAGSKTYDGNVSAQITSYGLILSGIQPSFSRVNLENVVVEFDTPEAGINKPVRIVSAIITGADAGNYVLSLNNSPVSSGTIFKKNLSVTGLTAESKTYDGTTDAVVNGTPTLVGVLDGDEVVLSGTPEFDFVTSNAGSSLEVSVSGLILSGASSANYELFGPVLFADILKRQLLMEDPVITSQKLFDGNVSASSVLGGILNKVSGDDLLVTGLAVFEDPNVGSGKRITLTYSISGSASQNYLVPVPFVRTDGEILPVNLTVTVSSETKVFGDLDPVYTLQYSGFIPGEDESLITGTPVFIREPGEAVGNYTVNVSGLGSGNYTLQVIQGNLEITQLRIQISISTLSKFYGELDPPLTYTTSPEVGTVLANGLRVELNGSLQREPGEAVGDYQIDIGTVQSLNPDYLIGYVGGLLNILPKEIVVVAQSKSKVYGNLDPALTFTSVPAVGETLPNGQPVSFTGELQRQPGEAIGSYQIWRGTLANPNFTFLFTDGQFDITALELEVNAIPQSKLYGELDPALTYTTLPALGTVLPNGETVSLSGALVRTPGEDVGTYAITRGTLDNPNLTVNFNAADFEISQRTITVTADDVSKIFGDTDPVLTYQTVPALGGVLPNGEVVSLTGSLSRDPGEAVGTYPITLGSLANPNFTIQFNSNELEILPLEVVVTAIGNDKIYGELDPEFSFVSIPELNSVLSNGQKLEFLGKLQREPGEDVGAYAIRIGDLRNTNFNITFNGNTLQIKPLQIEVTGENQSKTFGELDPVLTYTSFPSAGSGLANGEIVSFNGNLIRDLGEDVGTYSIRKGTLSNSNYDIIYNSALFTINPFRISISAIPTGKTFGEIDPELKYTSVPQLGTRLPNGEILVLNGQLVRVAGETVGLYPILQGNLSNLNFQIDFRGADFKISAKELVITPVQGQRKIYGEVDIEFEFEVSGLINENVNDVLSGNISRVLGENVGQYKFTIGSLTAKGNYDLVLKEEFFIIDPKVLTVKAENKEKKYGDMNPEFTFSLQGLTNGDTEIDQLPLISSPANQQSLVGVYPILITGGFDRNYTINLIQGELRILPRTLLIKADNQEMVYGGLLPSLTYTYSGLVNGDQGLTTKPIITTTATRNSNAGNYPIEISGGSNANYELEYQNGTLSIIPRQLKVIADSKKKVYGDANPGFTFSVEGFVNGDKNLESLPVFETQANNQSNVGSYPILIGGGSHKNYSLSYKNGLLEITPAELTVSANSISKFFGLADPDLKFNVVGFKLNDGINLQTGNLNRAPGESVGTYNINLGTLRFGQNYRINFIGGLFEILPVKLVSVINPFDIQTPWGVDPSLLGFVQVLSQDGQLITLPVTWKKENINLFSRGTYVIQGSLEETDGIKNPDDLQAVLKVTVLPKPAPEDLVLSNNRFVPDPSNFFQVIGNLRVVDPIDDQHPIALVPGELDNEYFEIKENILFWSNAEQAPGQSQFIISVKVTDRDGNVLIKNFTVFRDRVNLQELEVYNSFSPNDDGSNDTWGVPDLRYYKKVRVHIFNREGRRVFYTENPDFRWDGTSKGTLLATDSFLWIIEIAETGERRTGSLNLFR